MDPQISHGKGASCFICGGRGHFADCTTPIGKGKCKKPARTEAMETTQERVSSTDISGDSASSGIVKTKAELGSKRLMRKPMRTASGSLPRRRLEECGKSKDLKRSPRTILIMPKTSPRIRQSKRTSQRRLDSNLVAAGKSS